MTKLMEWLLFGTVVLGAWLAVVTGNIDSSLEGTGWHQIVFFFPIILLFLFGLYAVAVVLYRVFTFNNCESAAAELQQEIEEAKKDLQSRGIILVKKET